MYIFSDELLLSKPLCSSFTTDIIKLIFVMNKDIDADLSKL